MRKIWLVLTREYLTRVRTKGFVLSTLALPAFAIGMFAFEAYSAKSEVDHTLRIAILDNFGSLGASIASRLTNKLPNGEPEFSVTEILEHPSTEAEDAVRSEVAVGKLDAFLSVPANLSGGDASAKLHARNTAALLNTSLDDAVSAAVIQERLQRLGVTVPDVSKLVKGVDVTLIKVNAHGETQEKGQTFFTAMALGMVLYITVLVYGVSTMRSVIEEKSSRVIEILVASVRPSHLLAGKILGVGAVGLTQYLIWGVVAAIVAAYGMTMAAMIHPGATASSIHLPPFMAVYMAVFFLCGYLLYAALYAAIGAMVSSEQEAQQAQLPVTFLIVGAFLLFNIILRDPNSSASMGLSLVPFFSPILMVLRISLQTPPLWQIALAVAISLATTLGVVYFAARIYRVGILMYGKRPSLVELVRWLKYS
jgi:ABC-2 type transport system permease protein